MAYRNELEKNVRSMVAYDILSKPLSSLGQKAGRRGSKLAKETAELLQGGMTADRVIARTEEVTEMKARTLREAIDEFKGEFPKYGEVLEGKIQEKRLQRDTQLVYGLANGYRLGAEDYRRVMGDLGLSALEADAMYPHLIDISDRLGKAGEQSLRTILL